MNDLKSCPFCGCSAEPISKHYPNGPVRCSNPSYMTETACKLAGSFMMDQEKWNQRIEITGEIYQTLKRISWDAHELEQYLHWNSGSTDDWPVRISCDDKEYSDHLVMLLGKLTESLVPFRAQLGVDVIKNRNKPRPLT